MERLSLAAVPAPLDSVPSRFSSEQLVQARLLAASSGERVLDALGVLCELAPMPFVQCLGATLHYPVLDTDTLFDSPPRVRSGHPGPMPQARVHPAAP